MNASNGNLWTLDELGTRVALALAVDYEGQSSGRVRSVPDRRTIRYYVTLGLIDRPVEVRGRTALYEYRHLLQLVALKRLQARGLSLAELQQRLVGLSNAALAELARLPADLETPPPAPGEPSTRSADFWKAEPAPSAGSSPSIVDLQGVRLHEEVMLLLSPARPIEPDDLEAIRTVAAPLLQLLEKRSLLGPHPQRRNA